MKGVLKMEEVSSSSYIDLNQVRLINDNEGEGVEKKEKTDNLLSDVDQSRLKTVKSGRNEVLFFKILFFQSIVSGFVLLTLFVLKTTFSARFKMVSSQLKLAINDGPKFYESFDSTLHRFKNLVQREKEADFENVKSNNDEKTNDDNEKNGDENNDVTDLRAQNVQNHDNEMESKKKTIL